MKNVLIASLVLLASVATSARAQAFEWGAYTGNTQESTRSFAEKLGRTPSWQMIFINVADGFPRSFTGNLAIFLEIAVDDDGILNGSQDAGLKDFAQGAAKYRGPIILALNEEVNGNSNLWSGTVRGNTPAKAIAAFQHEENVIKAIAPNVKFAYNVSNRSVPDRSDNSLTSYYRFWRRSNQSSVAGSQRR